MQHMTDVVVTDYVDACVKWYGAFEAASKPSSLGQRKKNVYQTGIHIKKANKLLAELLSADQMIVNIAEFLLKHPHPAVRYVSAVELLMSFRDEATSALQSLESEEGPFALLASLKLKEAKGELRSLKQQS